MQRSISFDEVQHVLQENEKFRKEGVEGDLISLNGVSPKSGFCKIDDVPILANRKRSYRTGRTIQSHFNMYNLIQFKTAALFAQTFWARFPFLKGVSLTNMLIAGGCIKSVLLQQKVNDIDIFVYGLETEEDAMNRLKHFILDVYKERYGSLLSVPDYSSRSILCNGHVITFYVDGEKIQLILRLYKSKSEILHGFDLGSSAVGFDGDQVYFTSLSKFCYENMVNILDVNRRSTTYESRLIKYFKSGFDIVLPNLNLSNLRTNNHKYHLMEVCEMPHMTFSYSKINKNVITVDNFYNKTGSHHKEDFDSNSSRNSRHTRYRSDEPSDYEFVQDHGRDFYYEFQKRPEAIMEHNIQQIVAGKTNFVFTMKMHSPFYYSNDGTATTIPMIHPDIPTALNEEFITNTYKRITLDLQRKRLHIDELKKYLGDNTTQYLLNTLFFSKFDNNTKTETIIANVSHQRDELITFLRESFDPNVQWIKQDPSTQLTSSINPIITNTQEWYGPIHFVSRCTLPTFFKNTQNNSLPQNHVPSLFPSHTAAHCADQSCTSLAKSEFFSKMTCHCDYCLCNQHMAEDFPPLKHQPLLPSLPPFLPTPALPAPLVPSSQILLPSLPPLVPRMSPTAAPFVPQIKHPKTQNETKNDNDTLSDTEIVDSDTEIMQ